MSELVPDGSWVIAKLLESAIIKEDSFRNRDFIFAEHRYK